MAEGERERACVPVPLSSGEREEDTHAHFSSKKAVLFVCVFYYCRTYYKAVRVGGGGEWRTCAMRDDEPRPVWMSLLITNHALVNAGVGRLCERRRGSRRGVREGACIGGATMPQPWTLRLTRNTAALAAASPTLLFRPL